MLPPLCYLWSTLLAEPPSLSPAENAGRRNSFSAGEGEGGSASRVITTSMFNFAIFVPEPKQRGIIKVCMGLSKDKIKTREYNEK